MKLSDDTRLDAMIADAIGFTEDEGYRAQACPNCEENCGWFRPGEHVECGDCGYVFRARDYWESYCERCGGTGQVASMPCAECDGSGRQIEVP